MYTIYDVPIVPYNLRREETVVQIAEALNYLADVTSDVFTRINTRIAENKLRVESLAQRLATANTKLNHLAGARKATQVFSSSKYPAEAVNHKYESIFCSNGENKLPVKKIHYDYKADAVSAEPLEPLQLYYVKVKQNAEKRRNNQPTNVDAINDVIVFNTGVFGKDLLHKSSTGQVSKTAKKAVKEESSVDIVAAPLSISENLIAQKRNVNDAYFYSPHLGNVPIIDVPLDLPDLPGIADDLRYTTQKEPIIAPSLTLTTTIPDLPEIDDDINKTTITTVVPPIQKDENVEIPPVITKNDVQTIVESNKMQVDAELEEPTIEKHVNTIKMEENVKIAPKPPVVSDARANLMEAIRQAGGAKTLKPITETEKSTPSAPAADLMRDLHAKLAMRRRGISSNKFDNPSTMDKISAMIPAPPAVDDASESNDDEEWDE